MKTLLLILFTLLTSTGVYAQLLFDKSQVTEKTLMCIHQIDKISAHLDFDNIDTLRAKFSDLIWMKMPFATDSDLWELTNYSNKFVRLQAFDLLLNFRDKRDTILQILEKNKVDTFDTVEKREGCIIYKLTVFQRMLDMTMEAVDYAANHKKEKFFIGISDERWNNLKTLIRKD